MEQLPLLLLYLAIIAILTKKLRTFFIFGDFFSLYYAKKLTLGMLSKIYLISTNYSSYTIGPIITILIIVAIVNYKKNTPYATNKKMVKYG